MSTFFKKKIDRDFEEFVKGIAKLEPVEFIGLARVLGIGLLDKTKINGLTREQIESLGLEENKHLMIEFARPMDEVLEEMMDRFLGLSRQRRKEINQILKDAQRGK